MLLRNEGKTRWLWFRTFSALRVARAVRKTENLTTAELCRSNEQSQAKSRLTPLPSPYKAPSDLPGSVPLTSDPLARRHASSFRLQIAKGLLFFTQ